MAAGTEVVTVVTMEAVDGGLTVDVQVFLAPSGALKSLPGLLPLNDGSQEPPTCQALEGAPSASMAMPSKLG